MTYIKVKLQVPGFHRWANAPERYEYLRKKHRHVFHITILIKVDKSRQIEFIDFKDWVSRLINYNFAQDTELPTHTNFQSMSCEQIAEQISEFMRESWNESKFSMGFISSIEVSEDDENSAIVTWG